MKRIFILTIGFLISLNVFAQFRVVESSERREPGWVNSLQRDYIVISAEGQSIAEAQNNALLFIKERIVTSVADNVSAESELVTEEMNINNEVNTFLEKYSATITTQSGDIPFLQGISLSKAEAYYWEKLRDRSAGIEKYRYHIKYPFSDFELRQLVMEFQKMQRELTEQLNSLVAAVHDVTTVEQINNNISELQTLASSFMDRRKDQAQTGISRYRELINSITLYEQPGSTIGELRFVLKAGNRIFATAQRPNLRSDCARITSTSLEGNEWVITYDTEYCYDDPENHIEVNYRFGTSGIRNKFYFNIQEDAVDISLRDPITFAAVNADEKIINRAEVNITLYSEYDSPFVVESVTLNFRNLQPIVISHVNRRFEGKGNHIISLFIDEPLDISKTTSSASVISRISGNVQYREEKSNKSDTYRIHNHPYSTSW